MNRLNRTILWSTFLLAFVASPLLAPRTIASLSGSVIRVPYDFPTIQEAVDAASNGSVVLVAAGIYTESVMINKPLSLLGLDKAVTVIDGTVSLMANNIFVSGFTIRESDPQSSYSAGIYVGQYSNCTIENNAITQFLYGILFVNSTSSFVLNNIITLCGITEPLGPGAIEFNYCSDIIVRGNVLSDNGMWGIGLGWSYNNTVTDNVIANSLNEGLALYGSEQNLIHHNSFFNNGRSIGLYESGNNTWDDGFEGNYWDSYMGLDDGNGSRVAGDGVGDTDLPSLSVDYRPLISPCGPVPVTVDNATYLVGLSSNSTVSYPRFSQIDKKIMFNVSGPAGTSGRCTMAVPNSLLRGEPWTVLLNSTDVTSQATITTNQTHTTLSLNYNHSGAGVHVVGTWVVPEFPSAFTLLLLLLVTVFLIVAKSKPDWMQRRRSFQCRGP